MIADKRKENLIILGVFLVCLLVLVLVNMLPERPGKSARVRSSLQLPLQAGIPVVPLSAESDKAPQAERRDISSNWGRDPFKPLKADDADLDLDMDMLFAEDDFEPAGDMPIKISLILISETSRTVTINGRIFKVGDDIQGERVIEIKENGIVLAKNEVRRFLPLRDSAVRVEVQNAKQKER